MTAVDCLGLFTVYMHYRPRIEAFDQLFLQFPTLWGLLWEYRDVVFSDVFYELTRSDREGVLKLRNSHWVLHNEF